MSFEETVLINFKAQENVSSTISKLNGEFQKLGNNKSLVNIKNNIDSYIRDTQRWKQALQDLEKANPQILKNTNFQEIKAQVESLQKAFQFSKDTFQRQAKWFQPGVSQPAKDLAVQSIRDGFAASEDNLGFHRRLSKFFTNEGVDRTPAELTKELEPPHKEKPDIDKTTTEKESQNLSKDIVNIDKSIKKLDSAIDKVVSALDKFNKALTSTTARDTKQTTLSTPDTSKFTGQNTEVPLTNPNIGVPVGNVQALDKETYNTNKRQQAIESLNKATVTYNEGIGQSSKYMRESTAAQLPMVQGQRNLSKAFEETAVSSNLFKLSANPSEFSSYTGKFQGLTTALGEMSMGLSQAQGLFTQFFGLIGSGSAVMDMFTAACERQTNQIMLQMNRSKESADSTYRFIQDLVVRLPGNDQFLNQLLNQTAAMNPNMSNEDLGTIGTATANYYMLAKAKGQNNYETERELRSYLLTGETLALRNSVLSSEIKLLKQGNTVYERSILLQKAMSNVGMDGIATYDSMNNALEELRGHFQKAFADTGEIMVRVLQPLTELYNAIDNLTGTKVSAVLIIIGVAMMSILSISLVLTTAIYSLSTAMKGVIGLMNNWSKLKQFIDFMGNWRIVIYASKTALTELTNAETAEIIVNMRNWIAKKLGIAASVEAKVANVLEAESEKHLQKAINASTQEQIYNNLASVEGANQTYYQAMAKKFGAVAEKEMELAVASNNEKIAAQIALEEKDTIANTINTGSIYGNIRAKLSRIAVNIRDTALTLYDIFVKRDEFIITQIQTNAEMGNVYAKAVARINTVLESYARFGNISALNREAMMTDIQTLAEEGNGLAKILVRISTGAESLARRINAMSTDMETEAIITQLGTKIKDLVFKARDIALSVVQCARRVIHIGLLIAEAIAVVGLEAAWTVLDATITAATGGMNKVILGIIVAIGVLVGAVYELGKAFGWWSSISDVFDAIRAGLDRLWDAFVNNELIQGTIESFQNLYYTLESLFNLVLDLPGFLWELIFGSGDGGGDGGMVFDIVDALSSLVDTLATVLYYVSGMWVVVSIFDTIGSAIGSALDAWNAFMDSAEMQGLIGAFQEARIIIGDVFAEISDAFGELWDAISAVGDAFASIFSSDETDDTKEDLNIIVEIFRGLAWVISKVVVPAVQLLVLPLRIVAGTITLIAEAINWVMGLLLDPLSYIGNFGESLWNGFSALGGADVRIGATANHTAMSNPQNMRTGQQLTQTYNNTSNNSPYVVNNNFSEGSIQTDARNMTSKEVRQLFTGAFGKNNPRGV